MAFGSLGETSAAAATARDIPIIDPDAGEGKHNMVPERNDWQEHEAKKAAEARNDFGRPDN